jgi:hypothetical protein
MWGGDGFREPKSFSFLGSPVAKFAANVALNASEPSMIIN